MELKDLIRNNKEGFRPEIRVLRQFGKHLKKSDLRSLVRMKKRPAKLTTYIHKDKIAEIYKTKGTRADKEYYLIKAIDDTIVQVNY